METNRMRKINKNLFLLLALGSLACGGAGRKGPDEPQPKAPVLHSAVALSQTEIQLKWSENDDSSGRFRVFYGTTRLSQNVDTRSTGGILITGLSPDTKYFFEVQFFSDDKDNDETPSPLSNQLSAITL
jgi:hypothetical protein